MKAVDYYDKYLKDIESITDFTPSERQDYYSTFNYKGVNFLLNTEYASEGCLSLDSHDEDQFGKNVHGLFPRELHCLNIHLKRTTLAQDLESAYETALAIIAKRQEFLDRLNALIDRGYEMKCQLWKLLGEIPNTKNSDDYRNFTWHRTSLVINGCPGENKIRIDIQATFRGDDMEKVKALLDMANKGGCIR